MIETRQECYPSVVLFPISPDVSDSTPVLFSFYNKSGRRTYCFYASSAVTTTRASKVSTSCVKSVNRTSSVAPVWRFRSEPSKLSTASAVHIVESSTLKRTRWIDGLDLTDPDIDFAEIATVSTNHTSFQMKG
jgi:hypothetical protein